MSNPNDMLTFAAVAETGSFTKAAEVLMTPKSNVSRKVTKLENDLGVRLLERTTRHLRLTEAGVIYLSHCQRVKEEIDGAKFSLEALTSTPSGKLRICTTIGVGQHLLGDHLIAFQTLYPNVGIDIQLTNRRVDLIEENIDVAFRVGQSPDSNLVSKPLCKVSMHLYASPNYLNSKGRVKDENELLNHRSLYMSGQGSRAHWPRYDESPLPITPSMTCNDVNLLHQAAISGGGVALLPDYMCQEELQHQTLERVLPQQFGRDIDIFSVFPSRKGKLPKLDALLTYLTDVLNR